LADGGVECRVEFDIVKRRKKMIQRKLYMSLMSREICVVRKAKMNKEGGSAARVRQGYLKRLGKTT